MRADKPIRILFLVRSLDVGGAESQLILLAKGLDKKLFNITIAFFYDMDELQNGMKHLERVALVSLRKKGRWDIFSFGWRLVRLLKMYKPRIVHSFLPDANLIGLVCGKIAGIPKIVWGVRASNMKLSDYDWLPKLSFFISRKISFLADLIIYNSKSGADYHISHGYPSERYEVIFNGIDTDKFCPDPKNRELLCKQLGLSLNTFLIGMVARIDPMKDHRTFVCAASIFNKKHDHVHFILVGSGNHSLERSLKKVVEKNGLKNVFHWLGLRLDIAQLMSSFDILTSSSAYGEGFSNTIGEAMACGVPCVVTNVGDSAKIIGNTGLNIPPEDPVAMAGAWEEMIQMGHDIRRLLGQKANARIEKHFSVSIMVERTTKAYLRLKGAAKTS